MILFLFLFLPFNPSPEINIYQIPKDKNVWFIVDFHIPHSYLVYEKRGERYETNLELIVQVKGKKKMLFDNFWRFTQTLDEYKKTIDKTAIFSKHIITKLPLRKSYKFKVKIKDVRSGSIIYEKNLELKRYKEAISDLIPLDPIQYRDGKKKTVPRFIKGDSLLLYYELVGAFPPLKLIWQLLSKENQKLVLSGEKNLEIKNFLSDTLLIPLRNIEGDRYEIKVEFISKDFKTVRKFSFSFYSFQMVVQKDFDMLIDALVYIAEPGEIKALKNASPQEREKVWKEFWDKRDPTPGTPRNEFEEEYLRRVEYANKHFSIGKWPGYRTDRGMIYIKFGPPDDIENHPYEVNQKPYQIWYYYSQNRVFVFVDRLGIGEYELAYPTNLNYDF